MPDNPAIWHHRSSGIPHSLLLAVALLLLTPSAEAQQENALFEVEGRVVLQQFNSLDVPGYNTDPWAGLTLSYTLRERFNVYATLWHGLTKGSTLELGELNATLGIVPDNVLNLTVGQQFLPFGTFDTALISGTLPRELGSLSAEKVVNLSGEWGVWGYNAYWFEGSAPATVDSLSKRQSSPGYGLSIDLQNHRGSLGIQYISDLSASEIFYPNDTSHPIPALAVHASISLGAFRIVAEHIATLKSLEPGDIEGYITHPASPSATQLEIELFLEHGETVALSFNHTGDSKELGGITRLIGLSISRDLAPSWWGAIEVSKTRFFDDYRELYIGISAEYSF